MAENIGHVKENLNHYLIDIALDLTGLGLPISFAGRGENVLCIG